eukprot:GILI01022595.1.p1 GENE.GILI01022595.1~~GILI01022595.1.p1  ORF type:complete len:504 (+),score=33.54 GILI01022595.1:54-1565(+)
MQSRGLVFTFLLATIVAAVSDSHTFREGTKLKEIYNGTNVDEAAVYTYARANHATPTISNPVVIVNQAYGLSSTGNISLTINPIALFAVDNVAAKASSALPNDSFQRVTALGVGAQVPATGTRTGTTSAVTTTTDEGVLLQTIIQTSRVFLYARVVARTRVPQTLLNRIDGMDSRAPQWSAAELKMWCNLPYLLSGRIDPLTGGNIRFSPPSGTPVRTMIYIVQCSDVPFTIDYELTLDNGDGTETTLENVQLITVYAMSGGLQLVPLILWFYVHTRNVWRGRRQWRNWVPNAREALIFVSILSTTFASVAGITWVVMSEISDYMNALRLVSLVIRDVVGYWLMPYIAGGFGTLLVTMTTRLKSLVIAACLCFAILNVISHTCENDTIHIDDATCDAVDFTQLVFKVCNRFFSFFILIQHIQKLSIEMHQTDDPALNSQFFRYKSIRSIYILLAMWPVIAAVMESSIVSWYNVFIVSIGDELEVLLFNFMCVFHLGVYNPLIF